MTLEQFNTAGNNASRAPLLRCCGSKKWAERVLARRPFQSREDLLETAESVWWTLTPDDWLEAFSAHPKIGESKNRAGKFSLWPSEEQSGVGTATAETVAQLAQGNKEYERRFGWIFLINATGKSAAEILRTLESRLANDSEEELHLAAGEQVKITRLRLNKLLDE